MMLTNLKWRTKIMTTENLINLMSGILSTEAVLKGKPVYEPITLEKIRNDVISRAQETLNIVRAYHGGALTSPMAWSVRNGIAIKIGYGSKNEILVNLGVDAKGKPLKFQRANGFTLEARKNAAIEALEQLIPKIEAGILDEAIEAKLASYRSRSVKGKAKRMGVHALKVRDAA
jgi:hypothetical protein